MLSNSVQFPMGDSGPNTCSFYSNLSPFLSLATHKLFKCLSINSGLSVFLSIQRNAEKAVTRPLERAGCQVNSLDFFPAKVYSVVPRLLEFLHCFPVTISARQVTLRPISCCLKLGVSPFPRHRWKLQPQDTKCCGYGWGGNWILHHLLQL